MPPYEAAYAADEYLRILEIFSALPAERYISRGAMPFSIAENIERRRGMHAIIYLHDR